MGPLENEYRRYPGRVRPILLVWLLYPCLCPAWAGDGVGAQLAEGLSHGEVTLFANAHFDEHATDDEDYPFDLLIEQEISLDLSDAFSFTAIAEYRADNHDLTDGIIDEAVEESLTRYYVNMREFYLRFSAGKVDVTLGKQVFAWGKADGFNPTDNLNPADYLDFLNSEKQGIPAAQISYNGDTTGVDLVYVPRFTPARTPQADNRWTLQLDPNLFGGLAFALTDRVLPEYTYENAQGGLRFWATIGGLDLALTYYKGYDPIPVAEVGQDPATAFITLTPVYNQIEEFGLSMAKAVGETALHLEASYRTTEDNYDDNFLAYVIGLNRSFYLGGAVEEVRVLAEYVDEAFIDQKEAVDGSRVTTDLNRPFRDTVLMELDFGFNEDNRLKLRTAYNLKDNDYLIQPLFKYAFNDAFKVETGVDLIDGDTETLWGNWEKNDRFWMHLHYYF